MDKKTVKNFVVGAALLLFAAVVFLGIESHGRLAESKLGVVAIIAIAVLLFLAAFLSKDDKDNKPSSPAPADAAPAPKADAPAAAPAAGTDAK
jgi:hypothetical protein